MLVYIPAPWILWVHSTLITLWPLWMSQVWVSRFEWEGIQFNWLAFSELVRRPERRRRVFETRWKKRWFGYGSIPMKIPFLVGWTSINPSYFDVNYRGTRFWHTAIWQYLALVVGKIWQYLALAIFGIGNICSIFGNISSQQNNSDLWKWPGSTLGQIVMASLCKVQVLPRARWVVESVRCLDTSLPAGNIIADLHILHSTCMKSETTSRMNSKKNMIPLGQDGTRLQPQPASASNSEAHTVRGNGHDRPVRHWNRLGLPWKARLGGQAVLFQKELQR